MSFSQGTACHVVPLLARLVLAAAFIPAGWNKLTGTATFNAEQAATLRSLGVTVTELSAPVSSEWGAGSRGTNIQRVALRIVEDPDTDASEAQDDPPSGANGHDAHDLTTAPTPPPPPPTDTTSVPETARSATPGDQPVDPAAPVVTGGGTAMALHNITLMVHAEGWPLPVVQAWAAMAVELLGGVLLVIGLFSRLWGLGLAATMGVAFWLTSWPLLQHTSLFDLAIPDFNRLFAQAGLFVLAFGLLLTGPGALSLDRLLFRPAGADGDAPAV